MLHLRRMETLVFTLSSLLLLAACDQATSAPNAAADQAGLGAAEMGPDYVATPAGWYHRSCVHEVPNGAHMSAAGVVTRTDGSAFQTPLCSHPAYSVVARLAGSAANPVNSISWVEWATGTLSPGNSYRQLTAVWKVPPAPTGVYTGQQYYSFPGLLNAAYIIQPVIEFTGSTYFGSAHWRASSWRCNDGSDCSHGPEISLNPGDSIIGSVTASNCVGGVCVWAISTVDITTGTRSDWAVDDGDTYTTATGGAVEVYGIGNCLQYPSTGIFYKAISLMDKYGSQQSPSWVWHIPGDRTPVCDFGVSSSASTVNLYHNIPGLSVSIGGASPNYFAVPSGGVPPYVFYWEWCAIDCGDAGPLKAGGVGPDEVIHGWQFVSTNTSVYWTTSGTLRLTLTDSRQTQSIATHSVP
jgi:hypothetical protein